MHFNGWADWRQRRRILREYSREWAIEHFRQMPNRSAYRRYYKPPAMAAIYLYHHENALYHVTMSGDIYGDIYLCDITLRNWCDGMIDYSSYREAMWRYRGCDIIEIADSAVTALPHRFTCLITTLCLLPVSWKFLSQEIARYRHYQFPLSLNFTPTQWLFTFDKHSRQLVRGISSAPPPAF